MLKTLTLIISFGLICLSGAALAQTPVKTVSLDGFRVGEKLTYTMSFESFKNVAYAELHTVSAGKFAGRDAVELSFTIKTLEFASAAFYLIDQKQTTFVSPDTGLPLYISKTVNTGGLPKETIENFLTVPTVNFDLPTMIHKIRTSGGAGSLPLMVDGKSYNVTFTTVGIERIKAAAGAYDTSIINVQSDYLTELGLKDLKINISSDEAHLPVLVRFKTARKGEFRAEIAGVQNPQPEVVVQPTPVQTPRPNPTPRPAVTPTPYLENQPLAAELSFALGEVLEYQISTQNRPVGTFILEAKERKQFSGSDSLLLTGKVTKAEPSGLFAVNDFINARVDPETLIPQQIDIKFSGLLAGLTQTAQFDNKTSVITFKGTNRVDAPVGTHSLLSLLYAIRSFNLKPSADRSNPVNDTRVAVFWDTRPYVFILRPATAELINLRGEKVSAQLISIITGNPQLDQLGLKIWLSNDEKRLPLRFTAGVYQADLVSNK